jgi:hypothetical protein
MAVTLGILALLEAKPGKGGELAAFLEAGRELAAAEGGTVTWYAFKVSGCSSGAIGRLVPEDVIGLVRYLRLHAAVGQ